MMWDQRLRRLEGSGAVPLSDEAFSALYAGYEHAHVYDGGSEERYNPVWGDEPTRGMYHADEARGDALIFFCADGDGSVARRAGAGSAEAGSAEAGSAADAGSAAARRAGAAVAARLDAIEPLSPLFGARVVASSYVCVYICIYREREMHIRICI